MRKNILYADNNEIKGSIDEEILEVIYYAPAIVNCYDIDVEKTVKS